MAPDRAIFAHGLNQNPYIVERGRVNEGDVITLHPFHNDPETITRSSKSFVDLRSIEMVTAANDQVSAPPLSERSQSVGSSTDLPAIPNCIISNTSSHTPRHGNIRGSFRPDQHDSSGFHETKSASKESIGTLLRANDIQQLNPDLGIALPQLYHLSSVASEDKRNGFVIDFMPDAASARGLTLHRAEGVYELEASPVNVSQSHNRKSSAPSIPERSTLRLSDRSSSKYSSSQKTIYKHARKSSSMSKIYRGIPPVSRIGLPQQPPSDAANPYVISQKIAEMQAATTRLKGPAPRSSINNTSRSILGNSEDNMKILRRARTTYKRFSNFITKKPTLRELAGSTVTPFDRRLNESQNFGDSSRKLSQLTNSCKIPRKPLPNEATSLRSCQSNENGGQTFAGSLLGPRRATENFELAIARGDLGFLSEDDMEDDLIEEKPASENARSKSKRHSILRSFADLASSKKRHSSAPTCRSVGTILSLSPDGESTPKLRMEPRFEAFQKNGDRDVSAELLDDGPVDEKRFSKTSLTSLEIDAAYVPYRGTRARRPAHLQNVTLEKRLGLWTKPASRQKPEEMKMGQEESATNSAESNAAPPPVVRHHRPTLPKLIIPTGVSLPSRHDVRRKQVLTKAHASMYGCLRSVSGAEGAASNCFSIKSEGSLDEAVADDMDIAQRAADEMETNPQHGNSEGDNFVAKD